ncbi:ATP-binding protein [Clostridium aestuarii]|uniref:ATP-binding protein n=1 Tax=Clostridium aestuarii TaxID=338193 RepID=A0ABT4CY05_9CLOT|nr:ATP-binding protein [Clostridium aestuarii]MCY6482830.1 ATP-binding protein [Clostridium aestuarii]
MQNWNFFGQLVIAALEAGAILLIYLKIIQKEHYLKNNKLDVALFILIFTVFSTLAKMCFPMGYHSIVIIVLTIMVLSTLTYTNMVTSSVAVLICFIYIAILEIGSYLILSIFLGENVIHLLKIPEIGIRINLQIGVVKLLVVFFLYKFKKIFLKLESKELDENVKAYLTLGIFVVLFCLFSINIVISYKVNILIYQILIFISLMVFVIIGVVDYKKRLELLQIKNQFKLIEGYADNLEEIIDIIRKEKHDFANHINTIYAMCVLNKPDVLDRIKEYLNKATNNLEHSYRFFPTGIDYVDGLIAIKSNFAFENNIYLDVDFQTSLDFALVNNSDLVAIMSNILDNAFQTFSTIGNIDKKTVSVYGYIKNEKYYLSISNNGPMISKGIANKIFKRGFSTKSINKNNYGLGLYIVEHLVRKNDGKIFVSSSKQETEFLIEFKLKKILSKEIS